MIVKNYISRDGIVDMDSWLETQGAIEVHSNGENYKIYFREDFCNKELLNGSKYFRNISREIVIPRSFFGLHFHRYPGATQGGALDFGALRTHDNKIHWRHIETAKGVNDWGRFDAIVNTAQLHKADILHTFGFTPRWASARPNEPSAYGSGPGGQGVASEPTNLRDWVDHITAVCNRYKGRIKFYEGWNEVNIPKFFSGTQLKMSELQNLLFDTVKSIDPVALVISPSTVAPHGVPYFMELNRLGIKFDILGHHFYNLEKLDSLSERIDVLKTITDKPIWDTETGNYRQNDRIKGILIKAAMGVERVFYYSFDSTFGPGDGRILGLTETQWVEIRSFQGDLNFVNVSHGNEVCADVNSKEIKIAF